MQERGCDSFILDLRNNPGGLVRAGLDIARLWLPGEAAILTVEGREIAGTAAVLQVCLPTHIYFAFFCCVFHWNTTIIDGQLVPSHQGKCSGSRNCSVKQSRKCASGVSIR